MPARAAPCRRVRRGARLGQEPALTRGQGLLLVLPLVWERLRRRGDGWRPIAPTIAASFLPVAGFLTFSFYLQTVVGERETGLSALQIWGYKQVLPWDSVSASWSYITQGFASAGLAQSPDGLPIPLTPGLASIEVLNLVSLVLFTLLGLVVVRMLSLSYGLYAWSSLALLWTRNMWYSPLMSTSRYLLVLFPCFMVAGALLAGRPRAGFAWLCISGMLQVGLFVIWVLWGFVA